MMNKPSCLIDSKYLMTLTRVAKHRSVTVAAESLFMTQPAVSQHIKKIESVIGAEIFDRKESFDLTDHGRIMLEHAEKTLKMNENLFEQLRNINLSGRISIALEDTLCSSFINNIVSELKKHSYDNLTVNIFNVNQSISIDDYDLIFSTERLPKGKGASQHIYTSKYIMAKKRGVSSHVSKVVFCGTLKKNLVVEFLQKENITISDGCIWLATGSASMMENELLSSDTIVICPKWTLLDTECERKPLRQPINLYAWSRDDAIAQIVSCKLARRLRESSNPHDVKNDISYDDLDS